MKSYVIHCPYHQEQTGSCLINHDTGEFMCSGCQKAGHLKDMPKTAHQELAELMADELIVTPEDVLERHERLLEHMHGAAV